MFYRRTSYIITPFENTAGIMNETGMFSVRPHCIRYTVSYRRGRRHDAGCPLFPPVTCEGRRLSNQILYHVKKIIGDFNLDYVSRG